MAHVNQPRGDFLCVTCGDKCGDTTLEGAFVRCGYGSRHDTDSYIWINQKEVPPTSGYLCDPCLEDRVASEQLELVSSYLGPKPDKISIPARRALFVHGACSMLRRFEELRSDAQSINRQAEPGATEDAVLALRRASIADREDAISVGRAHAMAAIAFGCHTADPAFDGAAQTYEARLLEIEREDEEKRLLTEEMIAAIEKEISGP